MIASATSGALMRFDAATGMRTACSACRACPGEAAARHRLRDGRNARLVPADPVLRIVAPAASISLKRFRFIEFQPALDEIERGDAVDDEKSRSAAARVPHDLDREAHAVLERSAPVVLALVGARREELGEEVAFRAHHFDAVVARLAGERGGAREVVDRG